MAEENQNQLTTPEPWYLGEIVVIRNEGQDEGVYAPLAVNWDKVMIPNVWGETDRKTITLQQALIGHYENGNMVGKDTYKGILANQSIIQYLHNAKLNYDKEFFGIYAPANDVVPIDPNAEVKKYYPAGAYLGSFIVNSGPSTDNNPNDYRYQPAAFEDVQNIYYIKRYSGSDAGSYTPVTPEEWAEISSILSGSLAQALLDRAYYWSALPEDDYWNTQKTQAIARQEDIQGLFKNGDNWITGITPPTLLSKPVEQEVPANG